MKEANLTISTLTQEALLLAKEKKKALSRANAERRKAHAALMKAGDHEGLLTMARARVAKLRRSRDTWKEKAILRAKAKYLKVQKATRIVTHKGGRYLARVRQMYYHMLNERVSGNKATKLVRVMLKGMGLPHQKVKLPGKTLVKNFRVEAGSFSTMCAAEAMNEAKTLDPKNFVAAASRDGTGKRAISYQGNCAHFVHNGKRVGCVMGLSLMPNKRAKTQANATRKVEEAFVKKACLSTGPNLLDRSDFKLRISDRANNEKATNKLECDGTDTISTHCLTHDFHNSLKHALDPSPTTHLYDCTCGATKAPRTPRGLTHTDIQCVVCEVWCHAVCLDFSSDSQIPPSFVCEKCKEVQAEPMEGDFGWAYQEGKMYGLVKLLSPNWQGPMSLAAPFRNWCAKKGYKVVEMPRKVGSRFSGALAGSATILDMRAALLEFIDDEVLGKGEGVHSWADASAKWLRSPGGLMWLGTNTLVFANLSRKYFKEVHKGDGLSVTEAYDWVHQLDSLLEGFIQDPSKSLLLLDSIDSMGMKVLKGILDGDGTLKRNMLRRMHTIFIRAHRRWIYYTTSYRKGGSTCVPELSSDKLRVCAATPCHTMFCESTFGVLDDVLKLGGPRMAPHRAAHTTMARKNAHFTNPRDMTEGEAEVVLLDARLEELKQSTQTQARALLWHKKDFGRPNTRKQGSHSKKQVTPESQDRVRGVGKRTPVPNPRYQ